MYKISCDKNEIAQISILSAVTVLLLLVDIFEVNIDYLLAIGTLLVLIKLSYYHPNFIIRYIMLFLWHLEI